MRLGRISIVGLLLLAGTAAADGVVVSKIYDPYVQPLETELEWRFVSQEDDTNPDVQKHSLGFGRSLSDRWAFELYAIGQRGAGESLSVDAYEVEAKWQLTEHIAKALVEAELSEKPFPNWTPEDTLEFSHRLLPIKSRKVLSSCNTP